MEQLLYAMTHEVRSRILDVLNRREASPADIAEEIGEKLGDVAYHCTRLHELGAIELVRTEPRRGATKHFYRAALRTVIDDELYATIPPSLRRQLAGEVIASLWKDLVDAGRADGFERPDAHLSLTPLDLDEQGVADVGALLTATMERIFEIQREAIERRPTDAEPDDVIRTEAVLMHFVRAAAPDDGD